MATHPKTEPETPQAEVWTVSQISRRVKNLLEDEIGYVWVSGEISNWRVSPAGHAYFTLKDENSQLSGVMFRGKMSRVRFEPENGLEVLVYGQISVYEPRGTYQIICDEMQPKGVGALQLAYEKLKKKLSDEGLFDEAHKKPLPVLPRRIGIVTSPTGAAIRDILNVINRRFANVHVLLYPARVQGDDAAPEIVKGIEALDRYGVDVMIVGRGGGSLEDLWAFNEEVVVRAIFKAKTPIISAVGHEIDFTLSDFVADLRAPTPSAAAELVVKEQQALADRVDALRDRMIRALRSEAERRRNRLDRALGSYVFQRPEELVRQLRQRCDEARMTLEREMAGQVDFARHRLEKAVRSLALLSPQHQVQRAHERLIVARQRLLAAGRATPERKRSRFQQAAAELNALSPLAILSRGYALTWKLPKDELIRESGQLKQGDRVRMRFGSGGAEATIDTTTENGG